MEATKSKRGRRPKQPAPPSSSQQEILAVQQPGQQHQSILFQGNSCGSEDKERMGNQKRETVNKIVFVNNLDVVGEAVEDDNIILKLDIDVQTYDEKETVNGYSTFNEDVFESLPKEICDIQSQFEQDIINIAKDQEKQKVVIHLLKDFEQKNKNNEWPANTQIACYWCCHKFENAPFGIPMKYIGEKYHVYGCFCSLECCTAYNFASKESIDDILEKYYLINQLSREIGYKAIVKPAPNRLALKFFGGYLSIEEFRKFCHTSRIINITFPPMMTLTQQIEEINETDLNMDYKYVPVDNDRINKYKEKIKMKRSRPLIDNENTLDNIISQAERNGNLKNASKGI